MPLIEKDSWGEVGKEKESEKFIDNILFQMYQKWLISRTPKEGHLIEIGNGCAGYDQLVFITYSYHLSLYPPRLQRLESQKKYIF